MKHRWPLTFHPRPVIHAEFDRLCQRYGVFNRGFHIVEGRWEAHAYMERVLTMGTWGTVERPVHDEVVGRGDTRKEAVAQLREMLSAVPRISTEESDLLAELPRNVGGATIVMAERLSRMGLLVLSEDGYDPTATITEEGEQALSEWMDEWSVVFRETLGYEEPP